MPIEYRDTEALVVPISIVVGASQFSAPTQAIPIADNGIGPGIIPSYARLLDVVIHKEIAFDANTLEFGHGAVAGQRDTIATATEVAATAGGLSKPANWIGASGFGALLLTANRPIFARIGSGTVPTTGRIRLTLLVQYMSPRASL